MIEYARQSDIVFNCVDPGDAFDLAVQSLCLALKIPLIAGGTFSGSYSCDYFFPEGKACYLCMTDGVDPEIVDKLHPGVIESLTDLSWLPKNDNPKGQSNTYLCSGCANLMTCMWVNQMFGDPEVMR